ncbi:alpha/beta hydrolase [Gimesia algae]|uniref:Phospholipase YtpA n=1 Tax=Gimesia algae TaxID=2527971 RepID=A0A517V7P5_9PLAN|nr:alpha/beta fold hydrolase [Gimesia algae]QDT89031.1 Phospholipase YtpA [Gimesia algae]
MTEAVIEEFIASDGYRLQGRVWHPENEQVRVTLVILHGIQSHSGWYESSCRQLCEQGARIYFFDRRGSGLNTRDRGHASHWRRLVQDVVQLLSQIRFQREQPEQTVPIVLQGMSWGAKLATVVAAERPELIDGLALLYPGIKAKVNATALQQLQLSLAERLGIRDKRVPIPLSDPTLFTADPDWQKWIQEDPLALHKVSVAFLLANRELDHLSEAATEQINCPVFCQLAGQDQIIDNLATEAYFSRIRSDQKTLFSYPEARHTLEFEPDREQITADYIDWLNESISSEKIC